MFVNFVRKGSAQRKYWLITCAKIKRGTPTEIALEPE